MSDVPSCQDCAHLQGTSRCGRPVASYWNPATNQRRSRLAVAATFERSDRKFFGQTRKKCGPDGLFFEPRGLPIGGMRGTVIIDECAFLKPVHDTVADSDGDDVA